MFMLLVLIHELGHFISAKRSGVKVLEFGIWIPPKVCNLWKDKSGTEYSLNRIPLGGFVRLKWEDPDKEEDFKAKDSFIKAKLRRKIIILLAGVFSNFVLAWILFTIVFALWTKPISIASENVVHSKSNSYFFPTKKFLYEKWYITEEMKNKMQLLPVSVEDIETWSVASKIGMRTWDVLKSINKVNINVRNIDSVLKENTWKLDIAIVRKWKKLRLSWICGSANCEMWIAYGITGISELEIFQNNMIKFSVPKAMLISLQEISAQTRLTFNVLGILGKSLISFNWVKIKKELNRMTWPVGAVKIGEMLYNEGGWKLFLAFAGMISLALAVFNVLPIPALDGGRLLGVLIQWLGKLKPEKYFVIESYINLIFFILLMWFGVYIILKDLVRFWNVKIPFIG